MEPEFVTAETSDVETLLVFMRDFYEHENLTFDEQVARRALRQILTDDALGRVFLIRCGGEVIGYTVLTFGFSLEFRGRDAFVDELYIRASHRGRGIGKCALSFLSDVCRELDIRALHLEVERANTVAQGVYRKAGFADHDRYLMTRWVIGSEQEKGDS
ncbi:MAG TPA: GNAT family N-acetyltransferase [Blastocatellia bacterium]|nr:GNAT family N-acetyltransferase [Blastocatellia bacterium]